MGKKAIIMACGDFSGNKEMMQYCAPQGISLVSNFDMATNPNEGKDTQFYKRANLLVPIENAPFYGWKNDAPRFLTVLGDLRTNLKEAAYSLPHEAVRHLMRGPISFGSRSAG